MDNYYFKLACVDERNPLKYDVLEDVNLGTLEDVLKYVKEHFGNRPPENTKWIILPMKKTEAKIIRENSKRNLS